METIINLTKKEIDNITIFELNWELDETNADTTFKSIQEQIWELNWNKLILNLSWISYMNSKSIGYISSIYEDIAENDWNMYICNNNENVAEILDMVWMWEYIPMTKTIDEAIEALS